MSRSAAANVSQAWRVLLLEWEAVRNYQRTALLTGGTPHHDSLLDGMLPSLLYVNAVTILDDALSELIDLFGLTMPEKYRNDLNGRISFLGDQGKLTNANDLHRIRKRRNDIAHEIEKRATWSELKDDLDIIEATLQQHNLVGTRPKLDFYAERSAMDADWGQNYKVVVTENGIPALEYTWRSQMLRDTE